ncbi:GntR family transcriptional regulator [Microvirga sp. VF16]|uniref:GntR family transcriptional regulator n=1 Tax=Microvirga sp. VF16 TaxID=2807101 RepID=UPI00193E787F|nr:GntR family transcriptional regulator [Microvirga sp. VF16]QRM32660.1 GntR family transcriptional regulator [Microvirga sp. VF16]
MMIVDKNPHTLVGDPESPLSDRIVQTIADAIISGDLPGGARLRESELAQRYGVSRAPLREALRLLEERRLIERLPYSGVRVTELSVKLASDLYEIRAELEALACRRAAALIGPDQIAELEHLLAGEAENIDGIERGKRDRLPPIRDFHTRIAEIAGNQELLRLLSHDLWRHARNYYQRVWETLTERSRQTHFEHVAILEALKQRDSELAALLMRRHIERSRRVVEEMLSMRTLADSSPGEKT